METEPKEQELVTIDVDAEDWWVDPEQAPEIDDGDMRASGRVVLRFKDHDAVFVFMKKLIDRMLETERPDIVLNAVVDVYDTTSPRWITADDLSEEESVKVESLPSPPKNGIQDLQEILLAEREGAKIGRDLVEVGSRVTGLLRPMVRDNPEVAAALLSGYIGALIESMPGVDPRQLLASIFSAMKGAVNEDTVNELAERTIRRLERKGEPSVLESSSEDGRRHGS